MIKRNGFHFLAHESFEEVLLEENSYLLPFGLRTVLLFDEPCSFARDAHGVMREEGCTYLTSQIGHNDAKVSGVMDIAARLPSYPFYLGQ